jgi:hypothetical protein
MSMSHLNLSDRATAAHVRAQLAGEALGTRILDGVERRLHALRESTDQGSQTAEYAMVGGVGAAAAGALIYCVSQEEVWRPLVNAFIGALSGRLGAWF